MVLVQVGPEFGSDQLWKWSKLFTPKMGTKEKFLDLFSNYFVEQISFERWFYKVTNIISIDSNHKCRIGDF
jgi:hypothetical protein